MNRCQYCGGETPITAEMAQRNTQLSRFSHSPVEVQFVPLCVYMDRVRARRAADAALKTPA